MLKTTLFEKIVTIIMTVVLMWITTSYIEVLAKNTQEQPEYTSINFFLLLVDTIAEVQIYEIET